MEAILFVLHTGCQCNALNGTGICSSISAHRRFQEWVDAGLSGALFACPRFAPARVIWTSIHFRHSDSLRQNDISIFSKRMFLKQKSE